MIQQRINKIWAEALDLNDIGENDDFFALGGHSLIMARIQGAIKDEFGTEIPMDELFRHSTVAGISTYLESRVSAA
ncbi:phosphopantetheine-binding protein [Streptomyces sp. NPDC016469]|uniref:acyl carrier protein n=1 Tax=Streptomyces sp. NPDC016469 TaxID=3157191 RepID=UPI0033EE2FBC